MERKIYPSDITREQFETIRPFLESARKKTRPRKHDVYDLFCAVLYIVKSGCQWSMLPSDFPNYKTVHYYYCPVKTLATEPHFRNPPFPFVTNPLKRAPSSHSCPRAKRSKSVEFRRVHARFSAVS